jgi:hypothetical protein
MAGQEMIYPSDIRMAREAAVEASRLKDPNNYDKNGFSACRINFGGKKEPKGGRTTYYPWEINLPGRGWKKIELYFMNLKHVGKITELQERAKPNGVPDVALLFKGDYTYKRMKTLPNGLKVEVVEEYGKEKEWLCKAFYAHVKKHQQKNELSTDHKIRYNVKHERETKDKNGKIIKEPISPSNINITVPFTDIAGNEALKKDPKTKFGCQILDVERRRAPGTFDPKKDWPFEPAKARYTVKTDNGNIEVVEELNNGNIHKFLRGGSECSGFDTMGDVCISNMGISNPSKVRVLMVKQSLMQAVNPSAISQDDWDMIGGSAPAPGTAPTTQVQLPDGSFTDVQEATTAEGDGFVESDGFDTGASTGTGTEEFTF